VMIVVVVAVAIGGDSVGYECPHAVQPVRACRRCSTADAGLGARPCPLTGPFRADSCPVRGPNLPLSHRAASILVPWSPLLAARPHRSRKRDPGPDSPFTGVASRLGCRAPWAGRVA
jgi:hypothetical protein